MMTMDRLIALKKRVKEETWKVSEVFDFSRGGTHVSELG